MIDVDVLETLADIKDDIRRGIAKRLLIMETCDANIEIDDLIKDVAEYRRMCAALTWRIQK